MNIEEILGQDMFVLVAPDGTIQITTMAPDMPTCMAMIKLLHKAKVGQSFTELHKQGFRIQQLNVTIISKS